MPSFGTPAFFGCLEKDLDEDGCANVRYEIFDGQELLIGRDHKTCDIILTDPTVSNQHLRIYNIAYTADDYQHIFVYAKDLSMNGSYWCYKHGNHWKELLIGQGNAVLLSDGDKLRLCNGSCFAFRSSHQVPQCPGDASMVRDKDTELFANLFRITDRKLGSGAYGEVWMAVDNFCQRQMACKIVKLDRSPQKRTGGVSLSGPRWREVDLLKDISHPNILHVERVFFTKEKLYIISDLVTGGDLMSYIEQPWTNLHDAEACLIVYQVLKALEYLHGQGICHRDLKPENILMSTPGPEARMILADFGHSTKLSGGEKACNRRMKTASVGTDYYVAPEVRGRKKNTKGYTMAADMWSIGIITALLLTGKSVFEDSRSDYYSSAALMDAAAECDLTKMGQSSLWQGVSNLAKDFVRNLLILDEKARLNVGQALKHEWFTDEKHEKNIKHKYADAIRGWMPSRPLLDFEEDLALFSEVSRSTLDSVLMPPPAKPISGKCQKHPFGQQWSPFFSQTIQNSATNFAAQAGKKREIESDDDANTLSLSPKQAAPATRRPYKDSSAKNTVQFKVTRPAKSSAKQATGGDETLFKCKSYQKTQRPSTDQDYEESRLHDRVSREEASIFRSARIYGQCIEKRRRLRD